MERRVSTLPAATRGWRVNAPRAPWFVVRFVILLALTLAVPMVVPHASDGVLRFVPSAAAAMVIVVGFVFWRVEALLAFAIFVLFYETLIRWMGVPIRQIDEISVPLLFLIAGVPALSRFREWFWWPRDATIVAAIGLGLVSSLVNGVPLDVFIPALVLVTKALAFFYVAMWTGAREHELRGAMWIVLFIGIVVMALSFVELVDPLGFQHVLNLQEFYNPRGSLPSLKSLFFHPVLFAWFTAFVALYLYAHFAVTRRWWSLALALLLSLGPFLAARRRAILALLAGIGGGFLRTLVGAPSALVVLRRWLPATIGMIVILIIFMPGLSGLYELTLERYLPPASTPLPGETPAPGEEGGVEGSGSTQVRIALYRGSVELAVDRFPFGAGLGRYGSWMSRVQYSPVYYELDLDEQRGLKPQNPVNATDTFWPQILGELGVFGAIAYAAFIGALSWILWRMGRAEGEPTVVRIFRLGTGMVFVQAVVESLASPMFHSPPRAFLIFLAVGLVAAAWRPRASA